MVGGWLLAVILKLASSRTWPSEYALQVVINGVTSNTRWRCRPWRITNSCHEAVLLLTREPEVQRVRELLKMRGCFHLEAEKTAYTTYGVARGDASCI